MPRGEVLRRRSHDKGIDVALDVNYRGLLWSPEKAREVLSPIASKAPIIFCSRRDTAAAFGIEGDQSECSRNLTLSAVPPAFILFDVLLVIGAVTHLFAKEARAVFVEKI